MKVLKFYADISGLQINVDKTMALWIGAMRNSDLELCLKISVKWDKGPFKLLVVTLSTNIISISDLNYPSKINEGKTLLKIWS
jgi:hypothetical protein